MTQRLTFTVLAGSLCGLLFGYDIGAMAGAAPAIRACYHLSSAGLGLTVSSALIGTIPGSVVAGYLSDALGRRIAVSIAGALYGLAILGAAASQGLTQFIICRFLCGLAIGLISVVVPMYLAEIAPSKLRGRIVGSFQLSLGMGVVIAFLAGYYLPPLLDSHMFWRILLCGGVIPAALCEACLLHASISPRWLAARGRLDEACTAMDALGFTQSEIAETDLLLAPEKKVSDHITLFSHKYLRPIFLAISIAAFNQLTGVNALLFYVLDVFKDIGSGRLDGRAQAVMLSLLSLVVSILAVLIIDKVGRKTLLLAGAASMSICLLLLPAIRHNGWPLSSIVIVLAVYHASFGFSQGVVLWVYLSEIFPLPVRARGQSLGSAVHWITNAFVVGIFPVITHYWGELVFVGLALIMLAQFFVILLFYPETKGRTLESLAPSISG